MLKDEEDARNAGTPSKDQEISVDRKESEVKIRKIPDFLVNPKFSKTKAKRRPKQAKKLSPCKNQPKITKFTNSTPKTQLNPACIIEGKMKITIGNKEHLTGTQGIQINTDSQISESVILDKDITDNQNLLKRTEVETLEPNKGDSREDKENQSKGLQDKGREPLVKLWER